MTENKERSLEDIVPEWALRALLEAGLELENVGVFNLEVQDGELVSEIIPPTSLQSKEGQEDTGEDKI